MKKIYLIIAMLAAICPAVSAQEIDQEYLDEGTGGETAPMVQKAPDGLGVYELKVGDFTELNVVDGIEVECHCVPDSAGRVFFETTRNIADQLLFENNRKGKLTIQKTFHDENEMHTGLPTIHVFTNFLTKVTNAGDSTVRITNSKPTLEFKAELIGNGRLIVRDLDCNKVDGAIKTGNGTLVLTGRATEAVLSNTGVGTILADGLKCVNASCRFFGKGTTGVWVTGKLTVKGMFPGKLYYKGKPAKIKNYGMGIKLYPMVEERKEGADSYE